jgi:dihydropteroate synthase
MAVVNVTPDSFSDGGVRFDAARAIADAQRMVEDGADILDIGGESTRPGAAPLPEDEELRRVLPVIDGLHRTVHVPISIDTYKAGVADRAVDAGATIVNDISALTYDPALAGVVARRGTAVILMHNRGRSTAMYEHATYVDVVRRSGRGAQRTRGRRAGGRHHARPHRARIRDSGFAKRARPDADGTRRSQGASRSWGIRALRSFAKVLPQGRRRDVPPAERIWGTAAAVAASVMLGAHIVRVHDVREMLQVVRVADEVASRVAD